MINTSKEKAEKDDSSPMLFRHSLSITQQLILIYNTRVHKKNVNIASNVANYWCYKTPTCHMGGQLKQKPVSIPIYTFEINSAVLKSQESNSTV